MNRTFACNGLTCRQLQLSNTMRRLWIEHVLWTRQFIISTAFELPDLSFVTQRLLQNPGDFAEILQPIYGKNAAVQFNRLFTDHLLIAAELVNAAKAGNSAEAERQRKIWYDNAEEIAQLLCSVNCCRNECRWKDMLFDHLRMTENEAVYILTGEYQKGINVYDAIQKEALNMADAMTCGIIRNFKVSQSNC